MKHKETKATAIPMAVKLKVKARDRGRCIICGDPGLPNAHYIRRSQGGLGIEENIVTLCPKCHHDYDNGFHRREIGDYISEYLDKWYPDFPDEKRKYTKYSWLEGNSSTDSHGGLNNGL